MTSQRPVPVQSNRLANPDGTPNADTQRFLRSLRRDANTLSSGKASTTQTDGIPVFLEYPTAKDYRVVVNSPVAFVIDSVTTRCSTGTATVTVKINTTALGGTANSASTSEQTQAHTSANEVAVGDDVVITVSSVSSIADLAIMIGTTETLAP